MSLTHFKTRTRRGLTLIETLLALGIAAIVIIGAVAFFNSASGTNRANDAKSQVQAIAAAIQSQYSALGTYTGLSNTRFIASGGAPAGTVTSTTAMVNPWRGAYTIASPSPYSTFTIQLAGVPQDGCQSLLSSKIPNGTTITSIQRTGGTALTAASTNAVIAAQAAACVVGDNTIVITGR